MPDESDELKNEPLENPKEIGAGLEASEQMKLPAVDGLYCEGTSTVKDKDFSVTHEKTIEEISKEVNAIREKIKGRENVVYPYLDGYKSYYSSFHRASTFEEAGGWPDKGSPEYVAISNDYKAFLDEYHTVEEAVSAAIKEKEEVDKLARDTFQLKQKSVELEEKIAQQVEKSVELKKETVRQGNEIVRQGDEIVRQGNEIVQVKKSQFWVRVLSVGAAVISALFGALHFFFGK